MSDADQVYPQPTRDIAEHRKRLAPKPAEAFKAFSQSVFSEGAIPAKTKQLIAVAVAHVTQCPYCVRGHTKAAMQHGATAEEIMEAIWVAAEMRAGATTPPRQTFACCLVRFIAPSDVRSSARIARHARGRASRMSRGR